MARHGTKKGPTQAEREANERAILKMPEHERDPMREASEVFWARREWRGKDWPKPKPGKDPNKVAIVGFATSRLVAPYGEPGWELWCLNDPIDKPGIPARHAFTRWFQIHPPRYLAKHYPRGNEDLRKHWGRQTGIRLYMDRHYPEFPDSEPYPYEAVTKMTGHGWFHASSFDWMVALAIYEGFEQIDIYGCDFYAYPLMNGEPLSALPCLSYWCGVAEGRGLELNVFGGGHMFRILHLAAYESGLQYGWDREPALDLGTDVDPQWRDVR